MSDQPITTDHPEDEEPRSLSEFPASSAYEVAGHGLLHYQAVMRQCEADELRSLWMNDMSFEDHRHLIGMCLVTANVAMGKTAMNTTAFFDMKDEISDLLNRFYSKADEVEAARKKEPV